MMMIELLEMEERKRKKEDKRQMVPVKARWKGRQGMCVDPGGKVIYLAYGVSSTQ